MQVHDMFENIRNETQEEIKNSWWKNKSKYNLLRKLSKMKFLTDKLFIFPNEYTGQIISDDVSLIKNTDHYLFYYILILFLFLFNFLFQ